MDLVGNKSLRHTWDQLAQKYGDKTALVFEDVTGKTSELSYTQFNEEINRAANLFLRLGINKGDRVATQLFNSPEFLVSWFGLAKIGAVTVPINVQSLHHETSYIIKKCQVKTVVVGKQFVSLYQELQQQEDIPVEHILVSRQGDQETVAGTIDFNKTLRQQSGVLQKVVPLESSDPAEILFTSGTTSRPKGVVITHYNLMFGGLYTSWLCSLTSEDRYLSTMPACHIDFQCTAAMPTFTAGATFILVEKYSASRFWSQICLHRATITECIPLMIRTLMLQPQKAWEKNHCLREVMFYLNLSEKEKTQFTERFGVRLLTSYGMTETIVGNLGDTPGYERRWPSIGRPGFGYEIMIADQDGNEVPPLTTGEIVIKGVPGKTVFKEYYNNPEATAETLDSNGWLHTGDSAYMDEDGYFYFVDRSINLIKRSGENISGSEIENILVCHSKIAEAAVVGIPDDMYDEVVKAFVILQEGESVGVEEILEYCSTHMASFKVPSEIEIRTAFPRTGTGKVKKNILRNESIAPEASQIVDERLIVQQNNSGVRVETSLSQ
ncbi:crotonobetaine/carnitine-CoA ligase [Endozoicomonas sp. (ex Bugula neritina AB1)]|nr:crotonobetaine/carnitine-CoA ligase [Endozoicomonas sp. (ex Bugula neritina AB1)]